jgi:hypothetical protein
MHEIFKYIHEGCELNMNIGDINALRLTIMGVPVPSWESWDTFHMVVHMAMLENLLVCMPVSILFI